MSNPALNFKRIKTPAEGTPGAMYCAVVIDDQGRERFDGLYWLGSDYELYAYGGHLGEDGEEPSYPDYDFLVEQGGAFDASYAV